MVPKIIHCCWFGGGKTALALKCRESWRKFAPDWEVREWNESAAVALKDLPGYGFFKAALAAKKWAMASDWLRMAALYREGGVYLDYDHELVAAIDDLMGSEWMAGEWTAHGTVQCAAGAGLALKAGSPFARAMLEEYEKVGFDPCRDMMPWIVGMTADIFERIGKIRTLSPEVMSPVDVHGICHRTAETRGIHHYAMSWASPQRRLAKWLSWHGMRGVVELLLKLKRCKSRRPCR